VRIGHIAFSVVDPDASARWYLDVIGLAAERRDEDYGVVLTDASGLTLALLRGTPLPADVVDRVHVGCELGSADDVRAARQRLAGERELEWWDEPDYVSLKVADPDGHHVELFWEVV
jgi:catechol 2,3-dioxygenase-like lactoylglutathione lyase family enzyme